MLQALPKLLLLFRRQAAECGVVLQRALLLGRRDVFVAPQPVAAMAWHRLMPLLPLLVRRRNEMFLLLKSKPMRQQGNRNRNGDGQGRCQ